MAPRSQHATLTKHLGVLVAAASIALAVGQYAPQRDPHAAHAATAAQATPATAMGAYAETFDQYANTAPLSVSPPSAQVPGLDISVHSRDRETWQGLDAMAISHGAMCEGPPAMHQSAMPMRYEETAFICRDHLMTALMAHGYAVLNMTPNQMADFSGGEAVIRFDVSTLRDAPRDWWDVWVTPYEENLVSPLEEWLPALSGEPRRAVHARFSGGQGATGFSVERFENFLLTADRASCAGGWCWLETVLAGAGQVPSAVRRDTFELRISTTHVSLSLPAYGYTFYDVPFATPLDWTSGVVQIGHHSYAPEKACPNGMPGTEGCRADTFHWDNLSISPAIPFTQIRANERASFETAPGSIHAFTFPRPAPANAHLRVEAQGEDFQVSLDNGATWAPLTIQPSSEATTLNGAPNDGVFRSYWHPVPAGTQAAMLRSTRGGWWGLGMVDHAAIWSRDPPAPFPTPSVIPPTPTRPPADTPTPIPATTATALPTFTPTSAATATPAPAAQPGCARVTYRAGQPPVTEGCP